MHGCGRSTSRHTSTTDCAGALCSSRPSPCRARRRSRQATAGQVSATASRRIRCSASASAVRSPAAMQVGVADGAIVAYGVLLFAPGEAQLLNLTVAPEVRRLGIGRALLGRFLADAGARGAEQCFLEVRVSNIPAIALYAQEGFVPVARRIGYYPSAGAASPEDGLVMPRALSRGQGI